MEKILKILILEDSPDDVDLIERELQRAGMSFSSMVVNKREDYENALTEIKPDVILSDHSLPRFNSIEAFKVFKDIQSRLNLAAPFILITGAVSEEFAVQCIKAGVDDYILKDRLKRLPACITNALEKAQIEADRRKFLNEVFASETMLRQAELLANFGSWQTDLVTGISKWSDGSFRLYGFEPGEVEPGYERFFLHVHKDDADKLKKDLEYAVSNLDEFVGKYRIITKTGEVKYVDSKFIVIRGSDHKPIKLIGFLHDITSQTEYIQKIEAKNAKLKEIAWIQSHEVRAPLARVMGLMNIIQSHKKSGTDTNAVLNLIFESIKDLDVVVRSVVRKTEESPEE
ncbi:MAG TPA: PAS domain-containing protein [Cyclobacteriaceae bacterium]|nr:PAS domain-containing protein [Cyclobacteriaceae bacterium]